MSNPPGFAARLKAGPTAFAAWCGMTDSAIVDLFLREGYDCAVLDAQHGFHDLAPGCRAIQASRRN